MLSVRSMALQLGALGSSLFLGALAASTSTLLAFGVARRGTRGRFADHGEDACATRPLSTDVAADAVADQPPIKDGETPAAAN